MRQAVQRSTGRQGRFRAIIAVLAIAAATITTVSTAEQAQAGDGSGQLSLPWATGESWTLWPSGTGQGFHSWDGPLTPSSSFDFAGSGKVRAAADGTVHRDTATCSGEGYVRIDHLNGWQTTYHHLRNMPASLTEGSSISRGDVLGDTGTNTPCGGTASGNHVHFTVWKPTGAFSFASPAKINNQASLIGLDIGGWTIDWDSALHTKACLTRINDGLKRCMNQLIPNDGAVGSGTNPPQSADYAPVVATVSPSSGNPISTYSRGTNGALITYWQSAGGAWNGPLSLGGNFTGTPAAIDGSVFVRGPNGDLQTYWNNNGWNGPLSLGGNFTGSPSASPDGSVFVRGVNGDLQTYWYNAGWHGPLSLGGNFTGNPTAINGGVFVRGTNGDLQTYWYNAGWHGPLSLGGNFTGTPAVVAGVNTAVYVRGVNGDLQTYWYNNGWNGPVSLGGNFAGSPTAIDGSVFVRGFNGDLQTYWNSSGWHGPLSLGGIFSGNPAAVTIGTNGASVYTRGLNGDLQTFWQDATGAWNGPLSLGGNVIS